MLLLLGGGELGIIFWLIVSSLNSCHFVDLLLGYTSAQAAARSTLFASPTSPTALPTASTTLESRDIAGLMGRGFCLLRALVVDVEAHHHVKVLERGIVFLFLRDKCNPDDIHKWHTSNAMYLTQNGLDLVEYFRGGGSVQGQQGILWLLIIGSPVVLVLLLLSQEVNGPIVKDLHKWSSGPSDFSQGPDLVSDPKARKLQFGRGNLGN
jgi:hypothetical protein